MAFIILIKKLAEIMGYSNFEVNGRVFGIEHLGSSVNGKTIDRKSEN